MGMTLSHTHFNIFFLYILYTSTKGFNHAMHLRGDSMKVIDRELSWLSFNYRCLDNAARSNNPLLERLNFLGITDSNLSEFISVRFSYVLGGFLSNKKILDDLGKKNFEKKYENLLEGILEFKNEQYVVYRSLMKSLKEELGVVLIDDYDELPSKHKKFCEKYFEENVLPLLTPVAYDSTKELPVLADDELHFLIQVSDKKKSAICLMAVPKQVERVVQLSDKKFVLVEELIGHNIHRLFVGKHIEGFVQFKTYRYISNIEIDEEEFILDKVKRYLTERDLSNNAVFLDVRASKKDQDLVKVLYKLMDVYKRHIFVTPRPLLLNFLSSRFYEDPKYQYKPFKPQEVNEVIGDRGIMKYLQKEDLLIHHPYESFETIIDLIREAAEDSEVISIKQTLYRVSSNHSALIKELCKASQNGKNVVVMLELKARFSEKKNISLIETLKSAGVTIVYGFTNLKVHSKLLIIMKKTKKELRIFSHIGTGNYNEETAKIYTDISFLTSNKKIGKELNDLFNMISGFSAPGKTEHIYYSPKGIRSQLCKLIKREIAHAKDGNDAHVWIKVNAICDKEMIEIIYEAAKKGVKFDIICRGICSIVATKNIKIKSVVGRYLEHSRIYGFYNDGKPTLMISSADLLTRNLDHRVELMVPIKDKKCKNKLAKIFDVTWDDEKNSYWMMSEDGKFARAHGKKDCHQMFIDHSLESLKARKKK